MTDQMTFPDNFKDFIKDYSFKDKEEIYTNGVDLIPTFRVEQAWEHYTDIIYDYICEVRAYLDTIKSCGYSTDDILDEIERIIDP